MSLTTSPVALKRLGLIDYESAWELQRQIHNEVADGKRPNTLLLLEHPPVFTAGRGTLNSERPVDGSKVIDVDRGGKITFHGPGQIVGYPIIKLRDSFADLGYDRELANSRREVCRQLRISPERYCARSGDWIRDATGDRKIAAIGIRVARGVTMHGFALNVNPDLTFYERIIPCGIPDAGVTSMENELHPAPSIDEVLPVLERHLYEALAKVSS